MAIQFKGKVETKMAAIWETFAKNIVKENDAVSNFITAFNKQISAFNEGEENNRSWIKKDGNGFKVKLAKLNKTLFFSTAGEVREFAAVLVEQAQSDSEFKAEIEAAYSEKPESSTPAKKRGRPAKNASAE